MTQTNPKVEFIKSIYCAARAANKETGMSWELILAQAAQETGWGDKVLSGTNNLFNIKADSSWTGQKKSFRVWEIQNGKKIWVDADFRCYPTVRDALIDRAAFLKRNPRYAKAGLFDEGVKGDLKGEAKALQKAGYATDPEYAEKLAEVFAGKTMRTAVAEAEKGGCEGCKPINQVSVLDASKSPLPGVKVKLTQNGKSAEVTTNPQGVVAFKAEKSVADVMVEIWDAARSTWISVSEKLTPSVDPKLFSIIAPYVSVVTKTDLHVKVGSSKPPNASIAPSDDAKTRTHKVAPGETLGAIAKKYGVSYQSIAAENGMHSPYTIYPGQVLLVKVAKAPAAATSPVVATPAAPQAQIVHTTTANSNPRTDVASTLRASWLTFAERERAIGISRGGGQVSSAHIKEYATATSMGSTNDASYAYCAAFANWCLVHAGFAGTNNAMANSFRNWGRPTKGNKPAYGAIALIKFPAGGHHVTFVVGKATRNRVATLGGNQGGNHAVSHSACPVDWVVAFRYPSAYPDRDEDYELQVVGGESTGMSHASTH